MVICALRTCSVHPACKSAKSVTSTPNPTRCTSGSLLCPHVVPTPSRTWRNDMRPYFPQFQLITWLMAVAMASLPFHRPFSARNASKYPSHVSHVAAKRERYAPPPTLIAYKTTTILPNTLYSLFLYTRSVSETSTHNLVQRTSANMRALRRERPTLCLRRRTRRGLAILCGEAQARQPEGRP